MTIAKKETLKEEIDIPPVDELEVVPDIPEVVPDAVVPEARGPSARKALGTKEVIPFQWKLVGRAEGLTLTLFKSVDRDDSDAQLERVRKEGYYTELAVVDINAKPEKPNKKPVMKEKEVRRESPSYSASSSTSGSHAKKPGGTKFAAAPAARTATTVKKAVVNSPSKSSKKKSPSVAKAPAKKVSKRK